MCKELFSKRKGFRGTFVAPGYPYQKLDGMSRLRRERVVGDFEKEKKDRVYAFCWVAWARQGHRPSKGYPLYRENLHYDPRLLPPFIILTLLPFLEGKRVLVCSCLRSGLYLLSCSPDNLELSLARRFTVTHQASISPPLSYIPISLDGH